MNKWLYFSIAVFTCFCLCAPVALAESPWDVSGDPWKDDPFPPGQRGKWQDRRAKPWRGQNKVRWVAVRNGQIPSNAFEGGRADGQPLYICRTQYQNGTHVGKVVNRRCNIGWGGREIVVNHFQVLVERRRAHWVRTGQNLPRGAVLAGRSPSGDLYVCRVRHENGTHIGKLFNGRCNIGWGGKELSLDNYEVLSAPRARWLKAQSGGLPVGAVGGGNVDNTEMYVCRGYYKDGEHPGKTWQGRCNIGWGGQEVSLNDYDVLVQAGGLTWLPQDQVGNRRCVRGGHVGQENQCVCRANFRGGLHPGKTWRGRCNIGWGGQEFPVSTYDVLVTN
jgi:hypothetical protein